MTGLGLTLLVFGTRQLYVQRADMMIYNVSADSTLAGKDSYEALRNVPMIIAERNGSIR